MEIINKILKPFLIHISKSGIVFNELGKHKLPTIGIIRYNKNHGDRWGFYYMTLDRLLKQQESIISPTSRTRPHKPRTGV